MQKFLFVSRSLLFCVSVCLLASCSTIINSHKQKADMMTAYMDGKNDDVLKEIDYKLRPSSTFNSSVVNSGDEIMWRLEAGSMNFHLGNYQTSIDNLKRAEELIKEYDDRARISLRDGAAEVGAAVTNENTIPYRGYCRDRMALSIYKSLAYLGVDKESSFRAQLHRLRDEQKKIQNDYREFFEKEKAALDKEKSEHAEEAKKAEEMGTEAKISSDPQNAEFTNAIADMRKVANRGYGNFLNPAAIYLSGLGSMRDGQFDNARIDFQRLCDAMPNNPLFKQYLASALHATGRSIPSTLGNTKPFDFPIDRDCVYVIFANGRSGAFKQIALYFPIMTAWPVCEFYTKQFNGLQVVADNKSYSSAILSDMDGILAQEYNERLPAMITRIVVSTLIKEAAFYATLEATRRSSGTFSGSWWAVALAGTAYRALMNTADTRSWEILPAEFQLTQFPMPQNRTINLNLTGGPQVSTQLKIPANCPSAIIFVSAPSAKNVTYHILPLKSK